MRACKLGSPCLEELLGKCFVSKQCHCFRPQQQSDPFVFPRSNALAFGKMKLTSSTSENHFEIIGRVNQTRMDSTGYPWMYGGLLRTETSAYDPIATHQTLLISSDTGEIFVAFVMMFMSPTVTATPLSVGLLIKFWTQGRGFSSRYRAASFRACPLSVRFILWSRFMSKKKFKPFRYLHQLT